MVQVVDPAHPVRSGDEILSHLWHKGKFLTIALHGTFEQPDQAWGKASIWHSSFVAEPSGVPSSK